MSFFLYNGSLIFVSFAPVRNIDLCRFAVSITEETQKRTDRYFIIVLILAQRCRIEAYLDFLFPLRDNTIACYPPAARFLSLSLSLRRPSWNITSPFLCHSFCLIFLPVSGKGYLSNCNVQQRSFNSIDCTSADLCSCLGPRTLAFRYNYTVI